MAWYKEWFGEEYLELYAHRNADEAERHVEFVARILAGQPRAVLDLACGTGRHLQALRRRGYPALGVDLSLTLLLQGRGLPRAAADMRSLPFPGARFDWVLNFFTSFGYFESERQNFRVLEEIVRVLTPGGRFLIDLFNPEHVLANLQPREVVERDGRRIEVERWFDPRTQRVNKRIRVHSPHRPARTFVESVRAYREEEVTVGLRWAGLELTAVHGDFEGGPFQRDSPRLILVGHKPA